MKNKNKEIIIEREKEDRSGIYGYIQRKMAYNSNRIEGSTLTEEQTNFYENTVDFIYPVMANKIIK